MEPANLTPDFGSLRRSLAGTLHEPGDPRYTQLATPWNLAVATSPAAVVAAAAPRDVAATVQFAAAHGLPVTVQATGHGAASDMAGALLIHTGALNECTISTDKRTATVGAGTTWTTVLAAGAESGLVGLCGSAPGVGVAGYTSGGGVGPLARTFGAASDRVLAFNVVTGDGTLHHVTAAGNPDLFWGLRGGKGSLGIITSLEFELLPLPMVYAGALFFDAAHIPEVLRTWSQWCPTLPPQATTSVALMQLPALPGIPEFLAGKFTLAVRFVFTGNADDGGRWLAPVRTAGVPLMDAVGPMPSAMLGMVHSDPEDPVPATEGSALLNDFDEAAVDALLALAGPESASPQTLVEIRQFGGFLGQAPAVESAFCHRDAGFGLYTVGAGAPPLLPSMARHSAAVVQGMSAWAHGGTWPNFSTNAGQAGFATNYTSSVGQRLSELARHYDPSGVFTLGLVPAR